MAEQTPFPVDIGTTVTFSKTVGEFDVYSFAGITGDFAPNHVNEEYMRKTGYGSRIAHGALLVGYMSAASSLLLQQHARDLPGHTPVSLGYDRIRFTGPVFIGDTITVAYTVQEIHPLRMRSVAGITVTKQDGETVAVATHIMKWVPDG